jgi:hypothetical protein
MPLTRDLLERGYFPIELPPPFTTVHLANALTRPAAILPRGFTNHGFRTKPAFHNQIRSGALRRRLAIPNPVNYYHTSLFIERHWPQLQADGSRSAFSLSKPILSPGRRALDRAFNFDELPFHRSNARAAAKFILKTDISRCYPSIYTHSIPWAIHTKPIAKANKTHALHGNELDTVVRNSQDAQTSGIPIGPDSSYLIAEIVLNAVDQQISALGLHSPGFRYMDDYEFGFYTHSDAEQGLAIIQESLNDYELALNPKKTRIIQLPEPIEAPWASELRVLPFRPAVRAQHSDLMHYFDRAFTMAKAEPDEAVLKYAVTRITSLTVHAANWPFCEGLLAQALINEPGTIQNVLRILKQYDALGYPIEKARLADTLNLICSAHAPLGHGSEVAWALWGCIEFNLNIQDVAAEKAIDMQDSIVSLVALHARSLGLVSAHVSFATPQLRMTPADLKDDQWLLSYESNIKGWLPSVGVPDHVAAVPEFSFLKGAGVSFYDQALRLGPRIPPMYVGAMSVVIP